jgi:hypothetical protein
VEPSLEDFIAALPECPDCGEKLHRFAYCPGRGRTRPEAMPDPTQTENEGATMSNAVITKQGKPSKPGEVVDTSKAKVVPPSDEVIAEHAKEAEFMARTHAAGVAARDKTAKAKATKAKGKGSTKAKTPKAKAAAKRGTGNGGGPTARITESWAGKGGKEVEVGSIVKTPTGATLKIVGRWSKRKGEAIIPFVTGRIDALPAGATVAAKGKGKGDRMNIAAADCTVVKAPVKK